ncbi:unnamed protein product [Ilex paraguariensis]|uniref:Agglutinin domain-containing protein n=1 Tax=Ilex paraguariensis TaxID=185542 RepID=A0ABC8T183_9AQUA
MSDSESPVILPKHVAFKGANGKYLSAQWIEGYRYLKFVSDDIGDETVGNEIFPVGDGTIRIRSNIFGKFWRRSPNWIWADSDDTSCNDYDTLFRPIKVNDRVIALCNLGNDHFCVSLTTEGKVDCLNAAKSTITNMARLEVDEVVLSREITNIRYRTGEAKIYNEGFVMLNNFTATNKGREPNTIEKDIEFTQKRSTTWKSSVSLKAGISTTFKASVPLVADGEIQFSVVGTMTHEWGDTVEFEYKDVYKHTAPVPPRTTVKLSLLATLGCCDVPFSYKVVMSVVYVTIYFQYR